MKNQLQLGRPVAPRAPFNGKRLRRLRQDRDLSARRLADLVGCVETSIFNYEAGRSRPSRSTVDLIARALGVTGEDLK